MFHPQPLKGGVWSAGIALGFFLYIIKKQTWYPALKAPKPLNRTQLFRIGAKGSGFNGSRALIKLTVVLDEKKPHESGVWDELENLINQRLFLEFVQFEFYIYLIQNLNH